MKYHIKVGEQTFEVEIEDINKRPIIARVDGQEFEVSPQNGTKAAVSPVSVPAAADKPQPVTPSVAASASLSGNTMVSPLPGTIVEVFVKAGETVEAGTTILIIEAMKMKNNLRSVRSGKVAQILVSAGQTVAHKQALVEFEA
jgi:glutaconyl-CoA/methylmalonyl-CoA decarboxylase subunit gamma